MRGIVCSVGVWRVKKRNGPKIALEAVGPVLFTLGLLITATIKAFLVGFQEPLSHNHKYQ